MTRLRSRSLVSQFRTLFAGGTLAGLGEGELLDRFVGARDEPAFEELVARHGPMVLAVCQRWLADPEDVEDALQATFLVLVRKAGGLRDRQSVGPWLYGVAHRVARQARASTLRRREREMRIVEHRAHSSPSAGPDPSDKVADQEFIGAVEAEILRLPEKHRSAAVLCLVQGQSHEAAARALGWPLGTLKTRIAEARATLARRLSQRGLAPGILAGLARSEPGLVPLAELPDSLARRTLDAALAGSAAGAGPAGGTAGLLARRVGRAMVLARAVPVVVGLAVACALIAPAWWNWSAGAPSAPSVAAGAGKPAPTNPAPRFDLHGDALPAGAVLRLGTVRYHQGSTIFRIVYTPDGKSLVTDGEDSKLRVWDAATGKVVRVIDPEVGALNDFGLTADGRTALVVGLELRKDQPHLRRAAFVEVDTGRIASRASWPEPNPIGCIAINPARGLMAIVPFSESVLIVVDVRTGKEIERTPLPEHCTRLAFSPDGKRLAIELHAMDDTRGAGRVAIRDVGSMRLFALKLPMIGHGGNPGRVTIRDVGNKEIRSINVTQAGEGDIAFSPDGSLISISSFEGLGVWEVATGKPLPLDHVLLTHVAFSPDGSSLYGTLSGFGGIDILDLAKGRREWCDFPPGIQRAEAAVALSPDGRTFATDGGPRVLHLWNWPGPKDRADVGGCHVDRVNAMVFTPDGRNLLTASDDRTVRLWDLANGQNLKTFRNEYRAVALQVSANGRRVVVATEGLSGLTLWDLARDDQAVAYARELEPADLLAVWFDGDDRSVRELDDTGRIYGWDTGTGRIQVVDQLPPITPEPRHQEAPFPIVRGTRFDGGRRAAVVMLLDGFHVLDLGARKDIYQKRKADQFALSPDQHTLAIAWASEDRELRWAGRLRPGHHHLPICSKTSGTIVLLDGRTGRESVTIQVPGSDVWAMAFAPDGKTLAATTGWEVGRIRFYDVATGRQTGTIEGPPLQSPALAYTPDGRRLVSAMADGTILVWDVQTAR